MKRDPRLQGLSSEHHAALVLSRELLRYIETGDIEAAAASLLRGFDAHLTPHFAVEEAVLAPALERAGLAEWAERLARDHQFLRAQVEMVRREGSATAPAIVAFAERLVEHVRMEERDLFPLCERHLPAAVLDEVDRRVPHP